jgi:hypothetical protein
MPITYTIDHPARVVYAHVVGDYDGADMLEAVTSAAGEIAESGYNVIADHTRIAGPGTREQVERLVDRLVSLRHVYGGARWAVVTSGNAASYGMLRMFSVLAERVPMDVRIFETLEEAERWGRESPRPSSSF